MRNLMIGFLLISCFCSDAQDSFQLAPPILNYQSTFLSNQPALLTIAFNQPGAEIRYTMDGKEPTIKDKLYTGPIEFRGARTKVRAKAMGKGFLSSETVSTEFIKGGKQLKQITFTAPHEAYAKAGANILFDNIGGLLSYGGGSWLGYDKDTVEVLIQLEQKETIKNVLIDLLRDENSWIFLPEKITLLSYDETDKAYRMVTEKKISHDKQGPKECVIMEIKPSQPLKTNKLKLVFETLRKIPDWHNGKGNHGWFFIDEIKVF